MTISVSPITNWNASAAQYEDLNVYVEAEGLDWQFEITLDKSTGEITEGPVLVGRQPCGSYEPHEGEVPADVLAAVAPVLLAARKQLEEMAKA